MRERAGERVVIIGASLAGVSTALALAQLGVSSILIDKGIFPRRKACGEGLSARGVGELAALGISLESLRCETAPLMGYRILLGRRELCIPDHAGLVSASRAALDSALLDVAMASRLISTRLGVSVRGIEHRGGSFALSMERGEIDARFLVVADGAQSPSMRMLGGPKTLPNSPRLGSSSSWEITRGRLPPAVHTVPVEGGEVYLTPLSGDRVNVSILGRRKLVQRASHPMLLKGLIAPISAMLDVHLQLTALPLGCGIVGSRYLGGSRGGAFIVGDACETFDPCAGFGMTHALLSGRIAAQYVARAVSGEEVGIAARNYEYDRLQRVRDIRGFTRLTSAMMATALGRAAFPMVVGSGLAGEFSRSVHDVSQGSFAQKFCAYVGMRMFAASTAGQHRECSRTL